MVTGVGLNVPASCAAIRAGITSFNETRFMFDGEWLIGSEVPLDQPWRGREKLIQMATQAIGECLAATKGISTENVPLVLCLAERDRPGGVIGLDETLLQDIQKRLGKTFHRDSVVIANGRYGGVDGVRLGWQLLLQGRPYCVVAGTDSYLVGPTLAAYHKIGRLLTKDNSDGFIPGEAAAAVLLGPDADGPTPEQLRCLGIGRGMEKATVDSELPLRADGLTSAIKETLANAGLTMGDLDFRITDNNGEQYGFKEAVLALLRTLRNRKEVFYIWHPADCVGEIGAAIVPCCLAVILAASRKNYCPGHRILGHFGNDRGERAAMVLEYTPGEVN